jgi:hypothetical protein
MFRVVHVSIMLMQSHLLSLATGAFVATHPGAHPTVVVIS